MIQFSVYVKYWPTGGQSPALIKALKANLPPGGQVRILNITDRQWSSGLRFDNATAAPEVSAPEQLMIF